MVTAGLNKTPAQMFALAFGIVYLSIGLIGFGDDRFRTGGRARSLSRSCWSSPLNPLHNFVHIGIGLIWMVSSARHETRPSA